MNTVPFARRAPPLLMSLVCALAAQALLQGCGGGGGADASTAPPPAATSPSTNALAQQCSPNNPFRADAMVPAAAGTLTSEKRWLRGYVGDAYLWYSEIGTIDPLAAAYSQDTAGGLYGALEAYFEALKTPALTASGKRKDAFSFTYPTRQWRELAQSGLVLGYGIEFKLGSPTPPRGIRIAYVEPGSPAAADGLLRGDTLVSVDGISADSASPSEIDLLNAALFPTSASNHSFIFGRAGVTQPARSLSAAAVTKQPVLLSRVLDVAGAKVGYLVFNDHLATAEPQLIAAVNAFRSAGITDLVLDMRYNGGGYLYIASQLAYMIAGGARTEGQVFERLQFSDKRSADTQSADAATPFYALTCDLDARFNCTTSAALPALSLSRVFVLTSGATCSASESVVNGLRGIDVEVRLIGSTSCGKPYGFVGKDNCGISYFPIEFQGTNAKGFGSYADGFAPECAAADDLGRPLGDPAEGQLAAALALRSGAACPAPAASRLRLGKADAPEGALVRGPARENRVWLPLAR
jgi:carboxyl-terminal processing protease